MIKLRVGNGSDLVSLEIQMLERALNRIQGFDGDFVKSVVTSSEDFKRRPLE